MRCCDLFLEGSQEQKKRQTTTDEFMAGLNRLTVGWGVRTHVGVPYYSVPDTAYTEYTPYDRAEKEEKGCVRVRVQGTYTGGA